MNDPAAGIINHKRLLRVKQKDAMSRKKDELTLNMERAAKFMVGYIGSESVRVVLDYLMGLRGDVI